MAGILPTLLAYEPRLVAISGPLKGAAFTFGPEGVSLGRDPSNRICLPDSAVSRCHCSVKVESEKFTIIDLDSSNGTAVNGVPIKQRELQAGDEIRIGNSLFLFLMSRDQSSTDDSAQLSDTQLVTQKTVLLRREEALYLQPEKVL